MKRLDEEQRQRIVVRHRDGWLRHGHAPQALFWSSREVQEVRFGILAKVGIQPDDSLLDVGCGFADLKGWLEQHGCLVDYSGVDLSPELLRVAETNYPEAQFYCGELGDFPFADASFDWVMLSGMLNEPVDDDGAYARQVIKEMYRICRKGIAFNLLDVTRGVTLRSLGLQLFDPAVIEQHCQTLSRHVRLLRGYLPGDFTVYMWKEASAAPFAKNGGS